MNYPAYLQTFGSASWFVIAQNDKYHYLRHNIDESTVFNNVIVINCCRKHCFDI